ncbi:RNA polymerase sigma factor SigF, partial [Streptomyces sp. NPDC003863]
MSTARERSPSTTASDPHPGSGTAREAGAGAVTRRRALDGIPEPACPSAVSTDDARTLSVALFARLRTLEEG